jgi:hypothetical protein
MSMAKAMGPFRDSQAPSLLSGPRTDVPAKTHCNRGPQILNFERKSQSVPVAPKQFCSALQNFSSRPCLHDNDKLKRKNKIDFRTLYVTLYVHCI